MRGMLTEKAGNSRLYKRLFIAIFIVLFSTRIYFMESDLPCWSIMQYTPIDEGAYAMQSFMNYNPEHRDLIETIDDGEYKTWNSSASFALTMFCTLTLHLFGNNYYGLRMGSFLAALIVALLLLEIGLSETKNKLIHISIALILLFDFSFLMASKIVEPGIFRMLLITITLFTYWKCQKNENNSIFCYFLLGIFSILCVTWGYVTNVFVFLAFGLMFIVEKFYLSRKIFVKVAKFFVGACIGFILSELTMLLIQGRTFTDDFLRIVLGREVSRVQLSIGIVKNNIISFVQGNMFSYNAPMSIIGLIAFVALLLIGVRTKNRFYIFLEILLASFFVQSAFTSDFLIRKSIIAFPIIILNILFLFIYYEDSICKKLLSIKCLSIFGSFFIFNSFWRLKNIPDTDMKYEIKTIILVANLVLLILMFIIKRINNHRRHILILTLAICIPSILMSILYGFDTDKSEKQVMVDINQYVGKEYVLGGFPYSYCLYNQIIPLSSGYDYYFREDYNNRAKELLTNSNVNYFIGFKGFESLNSWVDTDKYEWILLESFETKYYDYFDGKEDRDIYLYKKVTKNDIVNCTGN